MHLTWGPARHIVREPVYRKFQVRIELSGGQLYGTQTIKQRERGESMLKRSVRNCRLSLLCLLAAALPLSVAAQDYPPNGPKIPPVALTGGGAPPPESAPTPGPRDVASGWNMELVGHNDLQGRAA